MADSPRAAAPKSSERREAVTIRFAGDSGDGMQLVGSEFTKASALGDVFPPNRTVNFGDFYKTEFDVEYLSNPGGDPPATSRIVEDTDLGLSLLERGWRAHYTNARYGWGVDATILSELGKRTIEMEREFNRQAGLTKADDRLPEWMTREPLPPHNAVFDVSTEEMDKIFEW